MALEAILTSPLYTLHPKLQRAIIPKTLLLLFLEAIFYLGVQLNLYLLELSSTVKDQVNIFTLISLVLLLLAGIYFTVRRALWPTLFYNSYLLLGNERINYLQISELKIKKNLFDHLFSTYTLSLGNKLSLHYIPAEINLSEYLQQLMNYSQKKAD